MNIPGTTNCEYFVSFCFDFASRLYNESPNEGKKSRCVDIIRQSVIDFERILGRKNKKTAESEKMLGLCYLKSGKLSEAEWHLYNSALALFS